MDTAGGKKVFTAAQQHGFGKGSETLTAASRHWTRSVNTADSAEVNNSGYVLLVWQLSKHAAVVQGGQYEVSLIQHLHE